MSPAPRQFILLTALIVLFFCSGVSALIYQVLWLRMLGWVFGVTIYAASTVWAMFMVGLALGGFAAGQIGDRVKQPLRWFGLAELLVGISAFATPIALTALEKVYVAVFPELPDSAAVLTGARFAIAFLVLIVPTTLMGATLPLVLKASAFRERTIGSQVGALYGSNAFGAIVGTIVAGLYLIPTVGIQGTFVAAASLNIAVGLSAIALSPVASRVPDREAAFAPAAVASRTTSRAPHAITTTQLRVVLLVFTLSGAIGLALEVVWFRVLTLFLRPTVYGFAVMLATVLGGITLGSYLVTPFLGRVRWLVPLALIEMTAGVVVVLSFTPLKYLPVFTPKLAPYLAPWMPDYLIYPIAASLLVIFPSTLLAGLAFPIGLHLWTSVAADHRTAERAGRFYGLNVFGAIAGSLLGGFVLLPMLGSRTSLIVLGLASLASGMALLLVSDVRVLTRATLALAATVAFAVAASGSPDPFVQFNVQRYPAMQPLYVEEGVEATVFVHEFGPQNARRRILTLNGNHQAGSDGPTIYVHRRIGHFPMILHPRATAALVVGLGGGATAGAVSLHDGVQVDVVELAGAVVNGARFFETINYNVLARPNVRVHIDDGRNYLMLTRKRYDVITADLIQPIFAGAGNLYSREYFTLMRQALKPGGIVMQWVPGTDAEFKAIARTFLSVFPQTTAWADGSLFVGSLEPLTLRRSDFDWKMQVPGRAQGLRDMGVKSFDDLLATYVAGPQEIRAFVGDGPLLTDDRPLAEYFLSLPRDKEVDLRGLKGDVRRHVASGASN